MIEKNRKVILLLILIIGFFLRFISAASLPINEDEYYDFKSAKNISFNSETFNLPLQDEVRDGSFMGFRYLIPLGWGVFGDSTLGARLPFVILGTLTILFLYFLVRNVLDVKTALIASLLLSISQFAIGTTRFADLEAIIPLFVIASLFLFYTAIERKNIVTLLLNGVVIGLGLWIRETLIVLIPAYIIFLFISREHRGLLKNKYLWVSFICAFVVVLPFILLVLKPDSLRAKYIADTVHIGISMGPFALYSGELFLLAIKPFTEFFNQIVSTVNSESLLVNYVLGVVILISVIKCLKDRRPFIRLLVVNFLFIFVFFSFFKSGDREWGLWNFESFYYCSVSFIPGVILAAVFLKKALRSRMGMILFFFVIISLSVRAWGVSTFPLYYFPLAKDFCIDKFLDYEEGVFRNNPNISNDIAKDVFEKIYNIAENGSEHKRKAALRLANLFAEEDKFTESKNYLQFILLELKHKKILSLSNLQNKN